MAGKVWGCDVMTQEDEDTLSIFLASCLAVLVFLTAFMIQFLPREISMFLVYWTLLSIPVGISLGHCVMNEP